MKVAYLVNLYPSTSHTFIRREIAALEELGTTVARFSLRQVSRENLKEPADQVEAERTRAVLSVGVSGLLTGLLKSAVTRPLALTRALRLAVRVGRRSDTGMLRHFAYLAEACVLLEWVKEGGCEHIHAHFGTNSATVAMFCHELGGPPFSYTMHHGAKEILASGGRGPAEKVARSKFVSAVSSFGRSEIFNSSSAEYWPKVHLVACGLDAPLLEAVATKVPDVPRFVCVGRLSSQKGQIILVEAVARLAASGTRCEVVLVGDGEMRKAIEAQIARHGLEQQFRITGWADGEAVRKELGAARALVLPSFSEGLPVAIMEALALGRPVVSTYVAGIPELVEPGRSGWLVPAGSVDALAEALRQVLATGTEELTRMGLEGQARVRERHDARKSGAVLSSLFNGPHGTKAAS